MYEIPTGDFDAQRQAEKIGAISTLGVGRTAPQGWKDGGSIHDGLKGVQLVSQQSTSTIHDLFSISLPLSCKDLRADY